MFFATVATGAFIGGLIGTKVVDTTKTEGELGLLAWGLVGVIVGAVIASLLGIGQEGNNMSCGCGRSPTGRCIGWHSLTESEYRVKLEEYNKRQALKEKKDAGTTS